MLSEALDVKESLDEPLRERLPGELPFTSEEKRARVYRIGMNSGTSKHRNAR
jgi:hypothetical protein